MIHAPPPIPSDPENAADDVAWHAPTLREVAEMGLRMARLVMAGAEARAAAGEATAADEAASSLALQRAAKLVRQTVALDMKRLEPSKPQASCGKAPLKDPQQTLEEVAAARAKDEADSLWFRKRMWGLVGKPMARNAVALAIETEADAPERERLLADLIDKLDTREAELAEWGPGAYDSVIVGLLAELGLTGKAVDPYYPQKIAARARDAQETEAKAARVVQAAARGPAMAQGPP